jgi:mRNA-degrading endonuclease RelE of RelBE toxin-antitoxin system
VRFSLALLLFFAIPSFAKVSCEVAEALTNPKLAQNEKFWQQLGELSNKGKYDSENISKLLAEHGVTVGEAKSLAGMTKTGTVHLTPKASYMITNDASKEVAKLPGHLRGKFNDFLEVLGPDGNSSLQNLRANPGRWNLKKLLPVFGENSYSARLNGGYRVTFAVEKDGSMSIMSVSKTFTHNN